MDTHILVVDDDALHSKMMSFLLSDADYTVSVIDGPRTIDDALRQHAVDLILLAVRPPSMDGFALCDRLKRHHSDTPIILLSASASTADLVQGFGRGADDYLARPYDPAALRAIGTAPSSGSATPASIPAVSPSPPPRPPRRAHRHRDAHPRMPDVQCPQGDHAGAIEAEPTDRSPIRTVRGVGYVYESSGEGERTLA